MSTFAALSVMDWNGDGVLDVIAASSAADASLFLGRAGDAQTPFEPAQRLSLPAAPYGAGEPVIVADYNADGDADIILYTPYRYMCFYEHSFVQSGYMSAEVIQIERIESVQ